MCKASLAWPSPGGEDLGEGNNAQLELFYQLARELTSTLDLEQLLRRVLEVTIQNLEAEHGFFFLLDAKGRAVRRFSARTDTSAAEIEPATVQLLEGGLAGWALYHQQVALAVDTSTDPRWIPYQDAPWEAGSALVVPLVHRGQPNGLLTLTHSRRRFFTERHAALAQVIAGQAAIAVENARLHSKVQEERSFLEQLIDRMPEPLLLTSMTGKVLLANQAARALWTLDEVSSARLEHLLPDPAVMAAFARARVLGEIQASRLTWDDGRFFDMTMAPIAELGIVVFLHDVSDLARLNALKSQLVAMVSHDLKNPLSWIYGYAAVLETEEGLSTTAQQCVRHILSSTARMQNLIDDLLDPSLLEERGLASRCGPSDVAQAIRAVCQELHAAAVSKGQQLCIELADNLPPAQMDPQRLFQVLDNLISNAVKYTQAGGRICVSAAPEGNGVLVSVQDNGPGIPQAAQPRLFEQFYRVEGAATAGQRGTGLGLSIARTLIESCGGRIGVRSQPGEGSTFWFWVPQA